MVKKNRISLILTRNKKGHPIYSREDIREQYCINKKEVEVLESGRSIKLLGCFTNPEDGSTPCSKKSILFSCIHRKKHSNSDENVYMRSKQESATQSGDVTAAPTPTPYDSERTFDDDRKSTYDDRSTDDEEYVLAGFRKRPKTVCQYDPSRAYWMDVESIPGDVYIRRRKLESTASIGSTSQHSALETEREYAARNLQRPSQLVIESRNLGEVQYIQGSHSVDELNDVTSHRTIIIPRAVKTPDISLDDRRPKHVSFDNGSLVRSNTVGGGLEDVVFVTELEPLPAATSTPLNAHRRAFSPPATTLRNRSKERLLDRSVRHWSDLGDSVAVSSSTMTTIAIKPDQNLSYRKPRKAMKTQATQTELTFRDRFSLPAYLTLSPRAHKTTSSATQAYMPPLHPSKRRSRSASKQKTASTPGSSTSSTKISKSKSAYEYLGSEEDTDEDVMEVDLSGGKQHRLVRAATSRASIRRQRAFDTSQEEEEIMVSFKPAQSPPRRPIEVLIGDRPVPRMSERERKNQSAIAREQTMEGFRQLREATAAATTALKQSQKSTTTSDLTRLKRDSLKSDVSEKTPSKSEKTETKCQVPGSQQSHGESSLKQSQAEESSQKVPTKSKPSKQKSSADETSEQSGLKSHSGNRTTLRSEDTLENTSFKSSSESSKYMCEKPEPQQKATGSSSAEGTTGSVEESTNRSEESSTVTTETLSPEVLRAQAVYQEKRQTYLAKYQQQKKESEMHMESPTSPDTESSSSIFTERETSRSEVSTSSSNNRVAKSDSESSDYVTAPDYSHREGVSPPGSQKKKTEDTTTHTSFESFSSPSSRSNHQQQLQRPQKSSTSPSSSASILPYDDSGSKQGDASSSNNKSPVSQTKIDEFDDGSMLSPPVVLPTPSSEGEEHPESSDESTKKESSKSSGTDDVDTTDWRCKLAADGTSGTPDSDRTSDITPVFDASPEPLSSLLEEGVETVIELRSETATTTATTSDEFPESINNEGSGCQTYVTSSSNNGDDRRHVHMQRTESESSESSCVLSGFQEGELRFGEIDTSLTQSSIYQPSEMKPSEELSTVSEVSEESSQAEYATSRRFRSRKHSDLSSPSDNHVSGERDKSKKSSSSECIPSEATTSSFESTTSGSFILENGSCNTSSTNNSGKSGSEECSSKKIGDQDTTTTTTTTSSNSESASRRTFDTGSESFRLAETTKEESEAQESSERHRIRTRRPSSGEYELDVSTKQDSHESTPKRERDVPAEREKRGRKQSPSPPSSTNSEKSSEKLATASSTTPFSSSPTSSLAHDQQNQTEPEQDYRARRARLSERPSRSKSVEEPEHSLSAWCSEGAIPKQKVYDSGTDGTTTRRRKDRIRIKSESKDHPPHLQLVPPDHHRHHVRSKSHSPEKSDEELDTSSAGAASFGGPPSKKVLCSQCKEKISEPSAPLSAPPPGMWERQYQRGFWDPVAGAHSHHHHHHHQQQAQQSFMWRQQQQKLSIPFGEPYAAGPSSRYGPYSGTLARSWSTECGPGLEADLYPDEDEDAGIHSESYRTTTWIYVTESDELAVWEHPIDRPRRNDEFEEEEVDPSCPSTSTSTRRHHPPMLARSDSMESTSSEHEFLRQYQAITHRMIHRKSSVEMYDRIASRTFEVDKRVTVQRNNGEFGFRIHGSKPVVVSAIERGTPAETCGLEVGDIIVCINGMNVLDASHSEVVRIAHTGTEVLKMEVTRTCHRLAPVLTKPSPLPAYAGYLQRLSARSVTGRRWCRRWFAVREDGVLYWYRTTKDHEPLGALVLQNHNISRVPDAGSPHAFKVSRFGGCPYYFSADDEDGATRWISALNQVASNASRVDPYMEQCVRNAQMPASAVINPDCQGYLAKLSQRWKSWKRRYFVLKDAALYFYVDRNAKVALGLFHLHGYKVQSCSLQGKKNTFEAIPPEPRLKHLYFQADSENEKKRWLAALEYSTDRWIKVG